MRKIAFVKTGWSDKYQGEEISPGRYRYVSKYQDGHERFNFLKAPDGNFYGYIPPKNKYYTPQPNLLNGWLVIFVAARNGTGPLTIIGWYEDATFVNEYTSRPEYQINDEFVTDVKNKEYTYCIKSSKAILIPIDERSTTISGKHFGSTPIVYAQGNNNGSEEWRKDLAKIAKKLIAKSLPAAPDDEPVLNFPDIEHRRMVEAASISVAISYLKKKKYKVIDKQKDNCGYDLLAISSTEELHIEVKGTSNSKMHFYITENEKSYMLNPKWRLLIVTNTLLKPVITFMNKSEVNSIFEFTTIAWHARLK